MDEAKKETNEKKTLVKPPVIEEEESEAMGYSGETWIGNANCTC